LSVSIFPRQYGQVFVCVCCGRYRVEEVTLDKLDGTPAKTTYRLRQGGYILGEFRDLDALAVELDERGILMWPDDGCE